MERDQFDEMLRTSPVFARSMFDALDGISVTFMSLIELLAARDVATIDEIISLLEADTRAYADRAETDFSRLAVEWMLRDVREFASDGAALVRRRLRQRKWRGRKTYRRRAPR